MSQNEAGFSLRLAAFTCLYVLFKRLKLLRNRTLKASFFSRKQLESESLVQFVIDSSRLVSQPNYFKYTNKDCDGLK